MVEPIVRPDSDEITRFFAVMFGDVADDGLIEIRHSVATKQDTGTIYPISRIRFFRLDQIEELVEYVVAVNSVPMQNVYFGAALRKPDTPTGSAATDGDAMLLTHVYADLDDKGTCDDLQKKYDICRPQAVVVTGEHPHRRAQIWWKLDEFERDFEKTRRVLRGLADKLGGDVTVVNPSRIMRVGGTIAWPVKPGRVREMTVLHTPQGDRPPSHPIDYVERSFPMAPAAKAEEESAGKIYDPAIDPRGVMASIRAGEHWHINVLRLVGHWVTRGWADEEILAASESLTLPGWSLEQTRADVSRMIRSGRDKWNIPAPDLIIVDHSTTEVDDGPFSAADLVGEPPKREWIVEDWIPARAVTSMYGDGGVGKTLAAQQLATAIAMGGRWFGLEVPQGPVLAVLAEDDRDELWRRQKDIRAALGIAVGQPDGDLYLWPRVGYDNALVQFDAAGKPTITPFFARLIEEARRIKPLVLIIDTAADMFAGNENSRVQVNFFLKAVLGRLVSELGCTVLLLAHPSLSGMQSGTGSGGNTAWNNGVRSRLYLTKPETGLPEERVLTRMKSNYAAAGEDEALRLVWEAGVLKVMEEATADTVDRIEMRTLTRQVYDEIECAWIADKPFTGEKGQRPFNIQVPKALGKTTLADKQQVARIVSTAIADGYMVNVSSGRKRGLMVDERPKWIDG